jgi:outer membrane protein OmpA-like peptidoglycan-associated protein
LKLSQKRAQIIVDYLVSKGVDAHRLKPIGYGKSKPVASNATEEGRAKNRRVEMKILEIKK